MSENSKFEYRNDLGLLDVDSNLEPERQRPVAEAKELMKIFGAIVQKCE